MTYHFQTTNFLLIQYFLPKISFLLPTSFERFLDSVHLLLILSVFYDLFHFANQKACELALKAKEKAKKEIFIAGSIPAQFDTYKKDTRANEIIHQNFNDQISCMKDFVDFFYLDVISSGREIAIASEIIDKINKPILVGIHLLKNGKLPSDETISDVIKKYKSSNWIGIVASCVSIEIAENSINELKIQNLPFGYKVNLWGNDEPSPMRKISTAKFDEDAVNLNTIMGRREVSEDLFKELGKKFGPIDLGFGNLGAYNFYPIVPVKDKSTAHANPEELLSLMKDLGVKKVIGMHWGTAILSLEPIWEPPVRFKENAEKFGYKKEEAIIFKIGEIKKLDQLIN